MDAEVFTVTVDSNSVTLPNGFDLNGSKTISTGYYIGEYYYPYTTGWTYYPQTIYMYQITCPKCKTTNWMQLDIIVTCAGKKCGAKLKAVTQQADYEIPITANAAA